MRRRTAHAAAEAAGAAERVWAETSASPVTGDLWSFQNLPTTVNQQLPADFLPGPNASHAVNQFMKGGVELDPSHPP